KRRARVGKHACLEILERLNRRVLAFTLTGPGSKQRRQRLEIGMQVRRHENSLATNDPSARGRHLAVRTQRLDLALEILRRREGPVYRCEPQVSTLVEVAQRSQDG